MTKSRYLIGIYSLFFALFGTAYAQDVVDDSEWSYVPDLEQTDADARDIIANNVMFYYDDAAHAMHFYGRVLGFKKVWEFDGRVIKYQTSPSSYITLVAKSVGLHRGNKPKTFTISFLTDQLDEWYEHAEKHEALGTIEFHQRLETSSDGSYRSFIIEDPEGYLLRFENYTLHADTEQILSVLENTPTLFPDDTQDSWRPANIGVKASIYWMYTEDAATVSEFYQDVFGARQVANSDRSLIYRTSNTGYLGFVRPGMGLLNATPDRAATISFLTSDTDPWYEFLKTKPAFEFRTDSVVVERDRMKIVVGYGPENQYIELNGFYDIRNNKKLLDILRQYKE